jgi:hypothetical protein
MRYTLEILQIIELSPVALEVLRILRRQTVRQSTELYIPQEATEKDTYQKGR